MRYRYETVYKELYPTKIPSQERVLFVIDKAKGNEVTTEWIAFKTGIHQSKVEVVCNALRTAGKIFYVNGSYKSKYNDKQLALNNMSSLREYAREVFNNC